MLKASQKRTNVDHHLDDLFDVVRLLGVVRDDRGQPGSLAVGIVGRWGAWSLVLAALRDVLEQPADLRKALILRLGEKMRDA